MWRNSLYLRELWAQRSSQATMNRATIKRALGTPRLGRRGGSVEASRACRCEYTCRTCTPDHPKGRPGEFAILRAVTPYLPGGGDGAWLP